MAKRGRPPLPEGAVRVAWLQVRLRSDELEAFHAAAAASGYPSTSEWVRDVLRVASRPELIASALPRDLHALGDEP